MGSVDSLSSAWLAFSDFHDFHIDHGRRPTLFISPAALQEFSSDMNSRAVKRIDDVSRLRQAQFPEDAGSMAHPIRPDSYVRMGKPPAAHLLFSDARTFGRCCFIRIGDRFLLLYKDTGNKIGLCQIDTSIISECRAQIEKDVSETAEVKEFDRAPKELF